MNPRLKVLLQRPRVFWEYLVRGSQIKSKSCPNCGGFPAASILDRRFGIMALRRCGTCALLYRTPTDAPEESHAFYQANYTEPTVTELPTPEALKRFLSEGFASKGSLEPYMDLARRVVNKDRISLVDYGCSWGYNTWRFQRAGFEAAGIEVSRPRCDFGRDHLGVNVCYSAEELSPPCDVFFSSHVFEHVPSVHASFEDAKRLLSRGGLVIIITPNGSAAFRETRPHRWHELWGRKHPNFLDDIFWRKLFSPYPHVLMSRSEDGSVVAPIHSISGDLMRESNGVQYDMSGEELIAVAQLPSRI